MPSSTAVGHDVHQHRLVHGGVRHSFQVWCPPGWEPGTRWPVVLFLHGAGERGSDGEAPTRLGLGPAARRWPERYPAVLVFPQCPAGTTWLREPILGVALGALAVAVEEFGGDPARTSVAGVSMGGYGAVELAVRRSSTFSAIAVICGGLARGHLSAEWDAAAARLAGERLWLFHGVRDDIVPVEESRRLVAAVRRAGGAPRSTEYADVRHDAWHRAFDDPALARWLVTPPTT